MREKRVLSSLSAVHFRLPLIGGAEGCPTIFGSGGEIKARRRTRGRRTRRTRTRPKGGREKDGGSLARGGEKTRVKRNGTRAR